MSGSFTEEFKNAANQSEWFKLPQELSRRFDVVEKFSKNSRGDTYLLADKTTLGHYVLKCYPKAVLGEETGEGELLRGLDHEGLPKLETEFDDGETLFVVREYVQGFTLTEYMEKVSLFSESKTISVIVKLCDILSYIHAQTPPVVHRDIKPSNIVIDPSGGSVKLIDFGIARHYSKDADNDTAYYGTRDFMAPEQYGYQQTDARTDIHAAGVLIRFMLTGEIRGEIRNRSLDKISEKSKAFDPNDRYQSAGALKKALFAYRRRIRLKIAASVAVIFMMAFVGFAGYEIGLRTQAAREEIYTFTEPLIERAVRAQLGLDGGRAITKDDLLKVDVLAVAGPDIFPMTGDLTVPYNNRYVSRFLSPDSGAVYGGISGLEDIASMKNIRQLALVGQRITDLTPLKGLPLEILILEGNPITDISPMRYCQDLWHLALSNTNVSDITVVNYMRGLSFLAIPNTRVASFGQISGAGITSLHVFGAPANDYDALASMRNLEGLAAAPANQEELELICGLQNLNSLELHTGALNGLEPLKRMENLRELILCGSLDSEDAVTALLEIESLQTVAAEEEVAELILNAIPDPFFEVTVTE